jgi:hypothetical protein
MFKTNKEKYVRFNDELQHNSNAQPDYKWFVNTETKMLTKLNAHDKKSKYFVEVNGEFDENGKELYFDKDMRTITSKVYGFRTKETIIIKKSHILFCKKPRQIKLVENCEVRVFRSHDEKLKNEFIKPICPRTIHCQDTHGNKWTDLVWY